VAEKSSPDSITLTYDLLKWAVPALTKFPRDQRFLLGTQHPFSLPTLQGEVVDTLPLAIKIQNDRYDLHIQKYRKPNSHNPGPFLL
jgi:hypothetical protein